MEIFSALLALFASKQVNNREAGDLRRHCAHYNVNVMMTADGMLTQWSRASAAMVLTKISWNIPA